MTLEPQPYVPPNRSGPVILGGPRKAPSKPWLALKSGETQREWHLRAAHTCYVCGYFNADMTKVDEHESEHDPPPRSPTS